MFKILDQDDGAPKTIEQLAASSKADPDLIGMALSCGPSDMMILEHDSADRLDAWQRVS